MSPQQRLELSGRHLKALVLDQLLQTIHDREVALAVHVPDVPRVQPSILVDRRRRGLPVIEISAHDLGATDQELAVFIGPQIRPARRIDDSALGIRHQGTHGAGLQIGLLRYPRMTWGPRTRSSPSSSGPRSAPLAGSTTRHSVFGTKGPTVPGFRSGY